MKVCVCRRGGGGGYEVLVPAPHPFRTWVLLLRLMFVDLYSDGCDTGRVSILSQKIIYA
jgi:hypothetical protein